MEVEVEVEAKAAVEAEPTRPRGVEQIESPVARGLDLESWAWLKPTREPICPLQWRADFRSRLALKPESVARPTGRRFRRPARLVLRAAKVIPTACTRVLHSRNLGRVCSLWRAVSLLRAPLTCFWFAIAIAIASASASPSSSSSSSAKATG